MLNLHYLCAQLVRSPLFQAFKYWANYPYHGTCASTRATFATSSIKMSAQMSWQDVTIQRPETLSEDQITTFKPFSVSSWFRTACKIRLTAQTWIANLNRSLALQSSISHPF